MTSEEAIKILEYPVKKWSMEWDEREDGLSYYEALDMAISALRQQDVTDKNVEKMTKADRIRAMSDEELAEFISSIPLCVGEDEELNCEIDVCKECFLKWIQQPAEEDDHA